MTTPGEPRATAHRLADCATSVLGSTVAGVILHGSGITDDFVPGRSDVDVLVVVSSPVEDETATALLDCVAAAGRDATTNVDFRVVTTTATTTPERWPALELEISVRPGRSPDARFQARRTPERDLAVEFSIGRQHGVALVGPDPAELIGSVPAEWVLEASADQLADWHALPFEPKYAELMVFTACRVWRFAVEGQHCPKVAAAQWVLERHPDLDVVAAAVACREGNAAELPEDQVRDLLDTVIDLLRDEPT